MTDVKELEKHNSSFKLRGKIVGLDKNENYKEGVTSTGKKYRILNFTVQTAPSSKIKVQFNAFEMPYAYAYNREEKKSMAINWDERKTKKLPKGYQLITPVWDIIDDFLENYEEEDSVIVVGDVEWNLFNGNIIPMFKAINIYKSSQEVDFDNDEPMQQFWQEFMVKDVETNKDEGKVYIYANVFESRGKDKLPEVKSAVFVINANRSEGCKKLANTASKFKYGDVMKAKGEINYSVITEKDEDDKWGEGETIKKYVKEMEITKIYQETYEKKKYKEKDIEEVIQQKRDEKELGKNENNDDEEDDDLPFDDEKLKDNSDDEDDDNPFND